jgi:hypothetical protein
LFFNWSARYLRKKSIHVELYGATGRDAAKREQNDAYENTETIYNGSNCKQANAINFEKNNQTRTEYSS